MNIIMKSNGSEKRVTSAKLIYSSPHAGVARAGLEAIFSFDPDFDLDRIHI